MKYAPFKNISKKDLLNQEKKHYILRESACKSRVIQNYIQHIDDAFTKNMWHSRRTFNTFIL